MAVLGHVSYYELSVIVRARIEPGVCSEQSKNDRYFRNVYLVLSARTRYTESFLLITGCHWLIWHEKLERIGASLYTLLTTLV